MQNKKIILTVGVPASGKTTWAEQYEKEHHNAIVVCRDDIRQELFGPFTWAEYKFGSKKELQVTNRQKGKVLSFLGSKWHFDTVIIADTNINPDTRAMWEGIARTQGWEVEYKFFHITEKEAIHRDNNREMKVGEKVIRTMMQNMYRKDNCKDLIVAEFKKELEAIWYDDSRISDWVLVDIDGTVADMGKDEPGRRSPFEWHRVDEDTPRETVINVIKTLRDSGKNLMFFSGRDGSCATKTDNWLFEHVSGMYALLMREEGDSRPDWIVKLELLRYFSKQYGKPYLMFDDRDQVVTVMRAVGVEVFQVAPGDF